MSDHQCTLTCDCPACSPKTEALNEVYDLVRAKRFDDALEVCRAKIANDSNDPSGYRQIADVLEAKGSFREALNFWHKVVALRPDCTTSYFSRGKLHYDMGDYRLAINDFTRSAELDHDQFFGPGNYLYRGDCHRRLGNYDAAEFDCTLVPDDFAFPGFLKQWEGTKHHLLAMIAQDRGRGER